MESGPPPFTASGLLADCWRSLYLSWALVLLGLGLLYVVPAPSLLRQLVQCGQGFTPGNLAMLGYLLFIAVIPVIGLWRLAPVVNLPRPLALLYLVLPLVTVAIYVARTVINFLLPDAF